MNNLNHSGFRRNIGVFVCPMCGRKTRGRSDSNIETCRECDEYEQHLNFHSDNGIPVVGCLNCKILLDKIRAKGGKV